MGDFRPRMIKRNHTSLLKENGLKEKKTKKMAGRLGFAKYSIHLLKIRRLLEHKFWLMELWNVIFFFFFLWHSLLPSPL